MVKKQSTVTQADPTATITEPSAAPADVDAVRWSGPDELRPMLRRIADMKADPQNVRVHGERDLSAVAASLAEFGQRKPIVSMRGTDVVLAGNGTMEAAKRNGWTHVAVVPFDDAIKARAYAIADNRTAELSSWDPVALNEALEAVAGAGFDTSIVGYSAEEVIALASSMLAPIEGDADPASVTPKEDGGSLADNNGVAVDAKQIAGHTHVKMLQIFLNDTTHKEFVDMTKKLASIFGTSNVTDTTFAAVKRVFDEALASGAAE